LPRPEGLDFRPAPVSWYYGLVVANAPIAVMPLDRLADPPQLRIGLAFPGDPLDAATWSGTPAGLARGLANAGVDVVALRAAPPAPVEEAARTLAAGLRLHRAAGGGVRSSVRRARAIARIGPELARIYAWAAARALRHAGPLDGVVQIGAGYVLPDAAPVITFEDLTIVQALECGYPDWNALSRRARASRIETQRRAYERATACCGTTSWAADSVIDDYGIPPAKVYAVGVGRNHTAPPVRRDWSTPRFLFIGKEWERKNGPGVLRAFVRLRRRFPDARLDVVGDHPPIDLAGVTGHGPLRLGVPAERRRVERLLQQATCFVMPSHYEPSALAYVEAGAAGVPSIASAVGGSAQLVGDGGVVVEPGDDEALLAAMEALTDAAVAARLGALAERRSRLFTWDAVAERILRAFGLPALAERPLAEFL